MTVRQDQNGKWFVQVDRNGMPRIRRGGFESEEAAKIFEDEYIANHRARHEQNVDKRTLKRADRDLAQLPRNQPGRRPQSSASFNADGRRT